MDGVVAHRHSSALELAQQGWAVAAASRAMADRFGRGGRLFAFGNALAATAAIDHPLLVSFDDPLIVKEAQVTTYHLLWELVQLFLEQADRRPVDRIC